MIEVDAEIYRWSASGMRRIYSGHDGEDYVKVAELKRLLEEAHERGRQAGLKQGQRSDF